mgnify:CR=1 FL=1
MSVDTDHSEIDRLNKVLRSFKIIYPDAVETKLRERDEKDRKKKEKIAQEALLAQPIAA